VVFMAPASTEEQSFDVIFKDLRSGVERMLYSGPGHHDASISPDGTEAVFAVWKQLHGEMHVVQTETGTDRIFSSDGGLPNGWLPDGSGVLCQSGQPSRIALIDLASGKRTEVLSHPTDGLYSAFFSADGKWITFHQRPRPGHQQLMAAPYRDGKAGGPETWVEMVDATFDNDKPRLSPDGGRLYFQSNRDGFICVWSQRVDVKTKRPIGVPEAVQHYHGGLRSYASIFGALSNRLHLSLAADRLLLNLEELRSDLWLLDGAR
jgi:eukaryotic-like serine/threonine-protein kinase